MIINEEKCAESVENSDGIIVALLKKVDYQKCLEILERKVKGTFKVKNLPVNASTISSVGEQAVEDATNEIEETVSGSGITQAVS